MNKEEAKSAEILFREALGCFGLSGSVGNGPPFSFALWALRRYSFYLCVLCELCG
jgi:hypothetical protein